MSDSKQTIQEPHLYFQPLGNFFSLWLVVSIGKPTEKALEQMERIVFSSLLLSLALHKSSLLSVFVQDFLPLPNRCVHEELRMEKSPSKTHCWKKSWCESFYKEIISNWSSSRFNIGNSNFTYKIWHDCNMFAFSWHSLKHLQSRARETTWLW